MKSISLFLPYVLPDAPGCPTILAEREIVDSAIKFCRETQIIEEWVTKSAAAESSLSFSPADPVSMRAHMVMELFWNGVWLDPKTEDDMTMNLKDPDEAAVSPRRYIGVRNGLVRLHPVPTVAGTAKARISTLPVRGAQEFHDDLFDDWVEPIASGALSRLLAMPEKAWSAPTQSDYHAARFLQGIADARLVAMNRGTRVRSAVRLRAFGDR